MSEAIAAHPLEFTILCSSVVIMLGLCAIGDAIRKLANSIDRFYDDTQPRNSKLSSLVEALKRRS